jgi:hypothetical protein
MLMLYLDEERTFKDGRKMNRETCEFILAYCFECLTAAEARLAFKKPYKRLSNFEFNKKGGVD